MHKTRPPRADILIVAARVITLEPERPRAKALALREGRILALGPESEVRRYVGPSTRELRFPGATVVPGLVDAHLHLVGVGERRSQLDLRNQTLAQTLARVRTAAAKLPPGTLIRGQGWDQNHWELADCPGAREAAGLDSSPQEPPCLDELGFPARELLAAAAPLHPVVLTRIDGHASWVNAVALDLAGVLPTRTQGGMIVRNRQGRPTGVLVDNAMTLVDSALPTDGPQALRNAILTAQDELLSLGLTEIHDMGTSSTALSVLHDLDQRRKLKLRVTAYLWGQEGELDHLFGQLIEKPTVMRGRRLSVVGVKLMADGALGSRGAALLAPYSDAKEQGELLLQPSELRARIAWATRRGLAVAIHAIGDRANRVALDALSDAKGGPRPHRIEHAQVVDPNDLHRFSKLGVVASVQPTHATSDMPWAEKRLGAARLKGAYAWRSLRAHGATLAAGSDAPVETAHPMEGLYAARTRQNRDGAPPEGWLPVERLDPEAALRAFTWGPAWAVQSHRQRGRIAVGYDADLTVLSVDPLEADALELLEGRILATFVGGEPVFVLENPNED